MPISTFPIISQWQHATISCHSNHVKQNNTIIPSPCLKMLYMWNCKNQLQGRCCLKMLMDDGRMTDACLYYKLTYEPLAQSDKLKTWFPYRVRCAKQSTWQTVAYTVCPGLSVGKLRIIMVCMVWTSEWGSNTYSYSGNSLWPLITSNNRICHPQRGWCMLWRIMVQSLDQQ